MKKQDIYTINGVKIEANEIVSEGVLERGMRYAFLKNGNVVFLTKAFENTREIAIMIEEEDFQEIVSIVENKNKEKEGEK